MIESSLVLSFIGTTSITKSLISTRLPSLIHTALPALCHFTDGSMRCLWILITSLKPWVHHDSIYISPHSTPASWRLHKAPHFCFLRESSAWNHTIVNSCQSATSTSFHRSVCWINLGSRVHCCQVFPPFVQLFVWESKNDAMTPKKHGLSIESILKHSVNSCE